MLRLKITTLALAGMLAFVAMPARAQDPAGPILDALVRKGILKQEELDDEMDKLYEEMEKFDEE